MCADISDTASAGQVLNVLVERALRHLLTVVELGDKLRRLLSTLVVLFLL